MSGTGSSESIGLPDGWVRVCLGDVLDAIEAGKSFTCEPRPAKPGEWGIVKVSAMTYGRFDETENKAAPAGVAVNPAYEISAGDVLVSRANTKAYVGAPVLVGDCRPRLLLSDKSLRLVPNHAVDKRWLVYALRSPQVRAYIEAKASGTKDSMRNISQRVLKETPLMLPPLAEQIRIVETLDSLLSRLDAAVSTAQKSRRRFELLRKKVFLKFVPENPPSGWRLVSVGEAGTVELGRARHPDWHEGPEMRPYLRVANVFEDRIDPTDVMEMDFSGVFEKYKLHHGDVLLNEGQSPHLVGRPALYQGVPENVAFTNSILRFRANEDVLPEWALMVFRRHLHAKRFMREVRITTNIAHLSTKRLKAVEFPIPPLHVQKQSVVRCDELLTGIAAVDTEAERSLQRAKALRKALLRKACSGHLVPQSADDESAAVVLHRIREERATQPKPKRARVARETPAARKAAATAPAPEPTEPPRTSTQQELSL
ncbi:restriction endonuclease subunit S [Streptomyces parvulus]|uniref:restriction endonuclease subunit S n=1 Tax=Streptomyces parvulus TaxID=146923 RepID=UPI0015F0A8AB|nr:restriction endonuclease subunit S [Streptomyces parvulus]